MLKVTQRSGKHCHLQNAVFARFCKPYIWQAVGGKMCMKYCLIDVEKERAAIHVDSASNPYSLCLWQLHFLPKLWIASNIRLRLSPKAEFFTHLAVIIRGECRLKVFQNKVMRIIYVPKTTLVIGRWV
jgi:hypothetical protein